MLAQLLLHASDMDAKHRLTLTYHRDDERVTVCVWDLDESIPIMEFDASWDTSQAFVDDALDGYERLCGEDEVNSAKRQIAALKTGIDWEAIAMERSPKKKKKKMTTQMRHRWGRHARSHRIRSVQHDAARALIDVLAQDSDIGLPDQPD